MHTLKLAIPAAVLMAGFLAFTSASYGKPDYAKKEKQTCTFCHVKAGQKDLNAAGKYYQAHDHSLEGYGK
jgi:cytochrome c553